MVRGGGGRLHLQQMFSKGDSNGLCSVCGTNLLQDAETATCYGGSAADAFVTDHVSIVRDTLGLGR